jgi:hypothetical protein
MSRSLTSRRKSCSTTRWAVARTLISDYMMPQQGKVSRFHRSIKNLLFEPSCFPELKDDNYQVPRSKSLIARRLPPANKSRGGSAGKYIAGTSAALGGRDDLLDRRVEAGSRAELLAKKGLSMPGMPGGKHLSARFDGKSDPKVSVVNEESRVLSRFLPFCIKGTASARQCGSDRINRLSGRRCQTGGHVAATGCPMVG